MEPDFIEQFTDALSPADCAALIARFERDGRAEPGATGSGVHTELKDSWDITISNLPEWKDAEAQLNNAMLRGLVLYVRKYPFAVLAPYLTRRVDPGTGQLSVIDPATLTAMNDRELAGVISQLFRPGSINIQKYLAGVGGYPHWHCEVYPVPGDTESLHRALLWTLYLNDDFEAGETEFFHQRMVVKPKTGSILIAPAGFTHTHRGNRPVGGNKYIATSWILMQKAETLYGQR
ncbi:MAG: 2OG-Fe(II) oxygenase [Proteobacteria bacterium]|nr:2OG-Fe(II) oxygenase [Pseudomonadota bacterium]